MAKTAPDESVYTVNAPYGLNLRESPGGSILHTLPHGTTVSVVAASGGWSEVKTKTGNGYVMKKYLRKKE